MSFFLSFVISLPTLLFFSFPFVTFRSYLIFSLHVLLPRIFPSNVPSLPPDLVFSSPPHPFSSPRRLFCPSFLFSLPFFTCLLLLLISPLDHPSSSPSLSSSFHPPIPSFIFRKNGWQQPLLSSPLSVFVSPRPLMAILQLLGSLVPCFSFTPLFSPFYHFIGPSSFNLFFSLPSFLHSSLLSLPPLCSQL